MAENNFSQSGFSDGLRTGITKQLHEGYHLGTQKGFEIGSEVGLYRGFAIAWLQHLKEEKQTSVANSSIPQDRSEKIEKVLQRLLKLSEDISSSNPRIGTEKGEIS